VQPRGVNRSLFAYRPPRERQAGQPLRIFSLRWLKPLYRVETLVRALGRLEREGIPFEARIAGEGPDRAKLEVLARSEDIAERITFIGKLEADDVPSALSWADVYVSTSSSDGASSSLFEAMSVGAYPVVTDIPANRGLVDHDRTGSLFPVGDDEALAEHLASLAKDDARRRAAIETARAFVADRLDYDRNMARIEGFLEDVARRGTDAVAAPGGSTA
jgi:glycosyltransferase involved in cell wall biosynthesis